jgi:outer membrane protein
MRQWVSLAAIALVAPWSMAAAEDLGDAVESAYRANPTLDGARFAARAAMEGVNQNRSSFLPGVDLNSAAGYRTSETEVGGVTGARQDLAPANVQLQASQALYTGGRRDALGRVAEGQVDVAQERLRAIEQTVLLAVVTAYVDVRRDIEQVQIRANNVDVLTRQLQAARDRFEVGEITLTDVAQAEARLAGANAGLAAAQALLEGSRAAYREVVGQVATDLESPPPAPPLPQNLDEAIAFALNNNPSIVAAEAAVAIAVAQVQVERAALRPQVSVVGSAQRAWEQNLPDQRTDSLSATAQVTVPLYEGGFARSRMRQARLNVERAEAEAEAARRQVVGDVTAAWSSVLAARLVIQASNEQVRANTMAFEGVEQEQQVGLRTTLDVLNAEQELLESRLTLVRAERDAYVAAHQLLGAIGALSPQMFGVNEDLSDSPDD